MHSAWLDVRGGVDAWEATYGAIISPDIFRPPKTASGISETWFADDACAIAWTYHRVCQISLLMHDPQPASSTLSRRSWLATYRALCAKMAEHAGDILSVNLGKPSCTVRSRMIQPLYVAGQCLWRESEQRLVISLLRGLEHDLGLASNYRVQALLQEWGTPYLLECSDLDAELSDLSS